MPFCAVFLILLTFYNQVIMKKIILTFLALFYVGTSFVNAQFQDLLDFDKTDGSNPPGTLIVSGKTLYGMTALGGFYNFGNVFSIDTGGSNFSDLFDFNSFNGRQP